MKTPLSAWDKVQISRHVQRPRTLDYVRVLCEDFFEFHGDRRFADDAAIVAGVGRIDGQSVVIIGHQKGRDTRENMRRNFGMPKPEGYRKAMRLFH
ncbi:MAG: acetyl-CoA carboxylase carboxyl transferase subunit alpha, partial [Chloroflexi bacterium]